jgi:hypothetical protein
MRPPREVKILARAVMKLEWSTQGFPPAITPSGAVPCERAPACVCRDAQLQGILH